MLRDLQAEDFYRHLKGERCSVHFSRLSGSATSIIN